MENNRVQNIHILFHGRFPSEKAASLFAAKTAQSFLKKGKKVTILAPARKTDYETSPYAYYKIDSAITLKRLFSIDLFSSPFFSKGAYYVSLVTFCISVFFYALLRVHKNDVVYSDALYPLLCARFAFRKTFYELHDFPERFVGLQVQCIKLIHCMLTTNTWKKNRLISLGVPEHKILVEMNAVDPTVFDSIDKNLARKRLGLTLSEKIVLYTGHLYKWKGVDTLALAASYINATIYFVGGTVSDVEDFRKKYINSNNIKTVGHVSPSEVLLWQSACDVVVLPNTGKVMISSHYTSPMKLFEYMASRRPIVASRLPSVDEILPNNAGIKVLADEPKALADAINGVLLDKFDPQMTENAFAVAQEHTWEKRADRILYFIENQMI